FRVETSTYSAEYGRSPGAQFTLSSRSGTNAFHGSGFDYLRNSALDANTWFNNRNGVRRQAERQNDFGGTLGGPVTIPVIYKGRDRTFSFFSSEEPRLEMAQEALTAYGPGLAMRANAPPVLQAVVNSFVLPTGPSLPSGLAPATYAWSQPSSLDSRSVRLDHTLNDQHKLFF